MFPVPQGRLTWNVVFEDMWPQEKWWHYLTGKRVHVWAFIKCAPDALLVVDKKLSGLTVDVKYGDVDDRTQYIREKGDQVVEYEVQYELRPPVLFSELTCVGVVKSLLGINKWWVVTPTQLLNEMNHGGYCS